MKLTIKLFASVADKAKSSLLTIELPAGATLMDVSNYLSTQFSWFSDYSGMVRYAVNKKYTPGNPILADGDEIAVIPPTSGG